MKIYLISEKPVNSLDHLDVNMILLKEMESKPPLDSELFIIDCKNHIYADVAIRTIRKNLIPAIYLRPIVLINPSANFILIETVDGGVTTHELGLMKSSNELVAPYRNINRELKKISYYDESKDTNIATKILRYLLTRNKTLVPYRSSKNQLGLHYPKVDIFMRGNDNSILQIFDFLEDQKLLRSEFFEKINICVHCNSSFLNFIEICPHCSSGDLEIDDLVHHFDCAYVAPIDHFKKNDQLFCPKCEKELRGIGVDYDKPAMVYTCNNCKHTTQEPNISTTCFHCGLKSDPEDLIVRRMKKYSLNALGENAAIHGLETMFGKLLDEKLDILPFQAFKIFLSAELERIGRYNISKSTVILFELQEFNEIYATMGKRTREIISEIGDIIKGQLRTCDITAIVNEATFIAILPETPEEGAKIALRRIEEKIVDLFFNNFKKQVTLKTETVFLFGTMTAEDVLSKLI